MIRTVCAQLQHALQGGLGLEAYDRGGPALVKAIYKVRTMQTL